MPLFSRHILPGAQLCNGNIGSYDWSVDSLTCLKSRLIMCLSFSYTVGIRNPNKFGFRMIKSRSVVEWSGFRMVLDLNGCHFVQNHLKSDLQNVRYSNVSGFWVFGIRIPTVVCYSDPQCIAHPSFCLLWNNVKISDANLVRARIDSKLDLFEIFFREIYFSRVQNLEHEGSTYP